ncbi:MAG TPA: hypothetical protein VLX92_26155 [Kofleriaceae bacterium]|nr:hypothetical protein [Kofleriaceae bacterium]
MIRALAIIAALAGAARAEVKVDWAAGLVTADGLGVADRHAPSPAVARGTSRRAAEDRARHALREAIDALPVAGGGKVGARAKDAAVKARLDRAIEAAFATFAEPETDGAWRVTMAVPIEAVRQAIAGPRRLPEAGDAGPPVIVIDGVTASPAVGTTVAGRDVATVWVTEPPAYARDAPHVRGHATAGAIALDGMQGTAATLYVIVTAK